MICEDRQMETCLQMDIYAYHYARRASAYKWFFLVFVYNHYPYKKEKNVHCCPSCLWYYKNNKNSLGFRLLCNHACIDITCQYERCSFVTSYLSIACGYPKKKHERTLCVGKRKAERGKRKGESVIKQLVYSFTRLLVNYSINLSTRLLVNLSTKQPTCLLVYLSTKSIYLSTNCFYFFFL